MKKVLLSFAALSMLAFVSCGDDTAKEGDDKKEDKVNKEEKVEKEDEVLNLSVDVDESSIAWNTWSTNVETKKHNGQIRMSEGTIVLTNGELTAGSATIDISSIFGSDVTEETGLGNLIGHLMAPDFFNIDSTGAGAPMVEVTGYADGMIMGNLTINGTSSPITVPATVTVSEDVVDIKSDKFSVDMTPFGMPFFAQEKEADDKGNPGLILSPEMEFEINLHAHK